jgi:hypothetical protein
MLFLDEQPTAPADEADAPSQDLPLIMPDDVTPSEPPRPARVSAARMATVSSPSVEGVEPDPVITETMAEVYLKQGLVSEAREVYRKLVQRRPADLALRDKLAALEQRPSPPRGVPAVAPAARQRFAAAETGGVSARSLFGKVLAARPGAPESPPSSQAQRSEDHGSATSAMDSVFASEPTQMQGEPTRPTSDELSLAAVFGEEPTPTPKPAAPQPAPPPGFSFDEFFGGKKPPEDVPAPEASGAEGETAAPDDFVSWLKGLKS